MLQVLTPAAVVVAGLFPFASSASSLPAVPNPSANASIIQVYDGCGPYAHRGPLGACRPGGQYGGYIPGYSCPAGWHVGPYGQHCWRNW